MTEHVLHVDVNFSSRESLEFTDEDYRWFGYGDIERGKREVEKAIQRMADYIDAYTAGYVDGMFGG